MNPSRWFVWCGVALGLVVGLEALAREVGTYEAPRPSAEELTAARIGPDGAVRRIVNSRACARCHPDVYEAWSGSAHRLSSFNNPWYRASVDTLRAERGPEATAFCGGCHDPAVMAAGRIAEELPADDPVSEAGIGCVVCHSTHSASALEGNGGYEAHITPVPVGTNHRARVSLDAEAHPGRGGPELCRGCHKVGLPEALTGDRWLRGQDEYDDWRDSGWSGRGARSIWRPKATADCIDCHMPRVGASPREKGARQGRVRDHRALGAHSALAALRGDEAGLERLKRFLKGTVSLDVRLAPDHTLDSPLVDVVQINLGVGHRLPGGVQDANEVWVSVAAYDAQGQLLAASGQITEGAALSEGTHRVRAQPVDLEGRPLKRRDAHRMAGVVYDTTLKPGQPRLARYRLPAGTQRVEAALHYRTFQPSLSSACVHVSPEQRAACEQPPVITLARSTLRLAQGQATAISHWPDLRRSDWARAVDHALALTQGLAADARAAERILRPLTRGATARKTEVWLALACALDRQGRTDDTLAALEQVDWLPSAQVARHAIRLETLHRAYRNSEALLAAELLAKALPDDRFALGRLARLRGITGDAQGSLEAADALLKVDPESAEGWFQRSLSLAELGRPAEAARARWLKHRMPEERVLALRKAFERALPEAAPLLMPLPTWTLKAARK